ncbi:MAG: oxidoreductase, partial [Rubellimicrobium sp.]|nr:oxidoreductase [Rubellimicrobium sp.]
MTGLLPVTLFAPLALLAVAALALSRPGRRPAGLPHLAELSALTALGLAAIGVVQLLASGPAGVAFGSGP